MLKLVTFFWHSYNAKNCTPDLLSVHVDSFGWKSKQTHSPTIHQTECLCNCLYSEKGFQVKSNTILNLVLNLAAWSGQKLIRIIGSMSIKLVKFPFDETSINGLGKLRLNSSYCSRYLAIFWQFVVQFALKFIRFKSSAEKF